MRILEMLVVVSCLSALIVPLIRKPWSRRAGAALLAASGGITAAQLLVEGYRWQMVPAYSVTALLIVMASAQRKAQWKPVLRYTTAALAVLLLGGSTALSTLLPVFHLPKPTGEYRVGTETFHFTDAEREETFTEQQGDKRELVVQVWYPAAKSGGSSDPGSIFPSDKKLFRTYMRAYSDNLGLPAFLLDYWKYSRGHSYAGADPLPSPTPYPVVLLSHGMGVGRLLHASQAENLASHGYVVFAIDHTYSTFATAFPDGRVSGFLTEQPQDRFFEVSRNILQVWSQDVSFVAEQLQKLNDGTVAGKFKGLLDLDNVGMLGHSFGGAAAFEAVYSNPRIKAGVNMDGTVFEAYDRDKVTKPFLFLESEEFIRVNERQANYRDQPITDEELESLQLTRKQFDDILAMRERELALIESVTQQAGGKMIYVEGSGHYNFTDLPLYSPLFKQLGMTGSLDGQRGSEIVNRYVMEFFNQHLRGMESELLTGPHADFPEVKVPDRK